MNINKFRAWDIRNKIMVEDALVLSETGQLVTVNAEYFNSPFSFFDGCIWMQFVGEKDKDGTDIYVGDILGAVPINSSIADAVVIFCRGSFIVQHLTGERLCEDITNVAHFSKIVGCVHE